MQAISKVHVFWGVVAAFGLLSGGCATGPQYEYGEQKDSASVVGPGVPDQGTGSGTSQIIITRVDGLWANFPASAPSTPGWIYSKRPLYLEPGKHVLTLDIAEVDVDIGETRHGHIGTVGELNTGSQPTLAFEFAANHVYRFTANLSGGGSAIDVFLWDETGGPAARSRVASWTVNSNGSYSENSFAPVHNR